MNALPSYLLTACALFSVVAAVEVWIAPLLMALAPPVSSVAWCRSTSPVWMWMLLAIWSVSGAVVAYQFVRGSRSKVYLWTIVSYSVFWTFALIVGRETASAKESDVLPMGAFLVVMIWARLRYERRTARLSRGRV